MTAPLTDQRLDEIEAAIPVEWFGPVFYTSAGGNHAFISNKRQDLAEVLDHGNLLGPLIAMAINALPELLAEIRRLRGPKHGTRSTCAICGASITYYQEVPYVGGSTALNVGWTHVDSLIDGGHKAQFDEGSAFYQ